ncbi:MAG: DUF2252 family protein [Nitrospirota bacterium]
MISTKPPRDIFLGWSEENGPHYYIRQLRDMKIKPLVDGMNATRLGRHSEFCGWALARAHSKSGDAAMISGYLGSNSSFDEAIAQFALSYAEQNERDHKALLKAIQDGRIPALQE